MDSGYQYGSYIKPCHQGSSGGGQNAGNGGGVVDIRVSNSLHLDGSINAKGGDASDGNSGGGSGGSIKVEALHFSGHGNIATEGGRGSGYGYGGAGGRIAVRVLWIREFAGRYISFGGFGGSGRSPDNPGNAAAGTIYYTDSSAGLTKREYENTTEGLVFKDGFTKLLIDNDNRNKYLATSIESESGSYFEFDEIEALNHVSLEMLDPSGELVVHKFDGDRTGLFHLFSGQTMHVEYVASMTSFTVAPVSYRLDAGSELFLPSDVTLLGTRTEIAGLLTNVHNLTLAEGASTVIFSSTQTALIEGDQYAHKTQPGNVTLAMLTVQRGSVMELTQVTDPMTVHVDTFKINYEGTVNMNQGTLNSNTGIIESEGLLDLSSTGHTSGTGPGAPVGQSVNNGGYGAAHGGHGGADQPHTGGKCLTLKLKCMKCGLSDVCSIIFPSNKFRNRTSNN